MEDAGLQMPNTTLDIGRVLFLRFYGPRRSRSIKTLRENVANIQPS